MTLFDKMVIQFAWCLTKAAHAIVYSLLTDDERKVYEAIKREKLING